MGYCIVVDSEVNGTLMLSDGYWTEDGQYFNSSYTTYGYRAWDMELPEAQEVLAILQSENEKYGYGYENIRICPVS